MKVAVTGANGFIGNHLVKALLKDGYDVRAMVRPTSDLRSLEGTTAEIVYGDILQPATLFPVFEGCEQVFHVAAVFSYWGKPEAELHDIAIQGTRNVLEAAHAAGVKKIILTASSVVLGSTIQPQIVPPDYAADFSEEPPYVKAKVAQEKAAFEWADKHQLDLVAVCPTITVGGHDFGLTESNRMIVHYIKDPLKATWVGGCNIVSAVDIAQGHILAAQKGVPGQRYTLGGENLEWSAIHGMISQLCGLPGPLMTAYHTSAYLAAAAYELMSLFTRKPPTGTRVQAKMVGRYYWYDHAAMTNLGYTPTSARQALVEAVSWLVASEHIPAAIRASMKLAPEVYAFRNQAAPGI